MQACFIEKKLYSNNQQLTINDFPCTVQIYDADITVAFNLKKKVDIDFVNRNLDRE